jgi:hypothetical protein
MADKKDMIIEMRRMVLTFMPEPDGSYQHREPVEPKVYMKLYIDSPTREGQHCSRINGRFDFDPVLDANNLIQKIKLNLQGSEILPENEPKDIPDAERKAMNLVFNVQSILLKIFKGTEASHFYSLKNWKITESRLDELEDIIVTKLSLKV